MQPSRTLRAAALIETAKGTLVLMAGMGVLSLMHYNAQRFAERLVGHLHLNPAHGYPQIFIEFAARATDARLGVLAAFAAAYTLVRFIEGYGLWRGRRWAEWFAALSGGIYIPVEIYGSFNGDVWLSIGALLVNVVVVGIMIDALYRGRSSL